MYFCVFCVCGICITQGWVLDSSHMKILERYSYNITRAGIVLTVAISNTVVAQVEDALAPITEFICTVGTALSGPVAIAIGLVLIAAGGIAIAVGGRRAMGTVLWGVVGITVATSAAALTTSLLGEGCTS